MLYFNTNVGATLVWSVVLLLTKAAATGRRLKASNRGVLGVQSIPANAVSGL